MALPLSYNVRNVRVRWQVTLLAIVGIALVVTVFVFLTAMSQGFQARPARHRPHRQRDHRAAGLELRADLGDLPRQRQPHRWSTSASPATPTASPWPRARSSWWPTSSARWTGATSNVLGARRSCPRPSRCTAASRSCEGRHFTPGLDEVIVGARAADRFGLDVGQPGEDPEAATGRSWASSAPRAAASRARSGATSTPWPSPCSAAGGYQSMVVRLTDPSTPRGLQEDLRGRSPAPGPGGLGAEVLRGPGRPHGARPHGPGRLRGRGHGRRRGVRGHEHHVRASWPRAPVRSAPCARWASRGAAILFSFVTESVFLAIVGGVLGCMLALPANGFTVRDGRTPTSARWPSPSASRPFALAIGLAFARGHGAHRRPAARDCGPPGCPSRTRCARPSALERQRPSRASGRRSG